MVNVVYYHYVLYCSTFTPKKQPLQSRCTVIGQQVLAGIENFVELMCCRCKKPFVGCVAITYHVCYNDPIKGNIKSDMPPESRKEVTLCEYERALLSHSIDRKGECPLHIYRIRRSVWHCRPSDGGPVPILPKQAANKP